jgi:hypothetical protein
MRNDRARLAAWTSRIRWLLIAPISGSTPGTNSRVPYTDSMAAGPPVAIHAPIVGEAPRGIERDVRTVCDTAPS